jgi:hypothetical protein
MRRTIITIGFAILLAGGQGLAKDFYSDGNIVAGEYWGSASIYDTPPNHTTVNMSGGQVDTTSTFDTSIFNMTGGKMSHLYSYEFSTANISGNDHSNPFDIYARDQSVINFSGTVEATHAEAFNTAKINMYGGTIYNLSAFNGGAINIYGGDITFNIWAQDNAVINIFGYDLFKSPTGGTGDGFVRGYYNDHSFFMFNFEGSETYSHVNLIPEPLTILLLGVGGLFLRKKD